MFAAGLRALPYAARAGRLAYQAGRGLLGYGRRGYTATMMRAGRAGGRIGAVGRGGRFVENVPATYYRGQYRVGTATSIAGGLATSRRGLMGEGDDAMQGVTTLPFTPQHVSDAAAAAAAAVNAANAGVREAGRIAKRVREAYGDEGGASKRLRFGPEASGAGGGLPEAAYIRGLRNIYAKKKVYKKSKKSYKKKKKTKKDD